MARAIDIAWSAGLFEGEGCATFSDGRRQPRASINMTDEDVVRKFHHIVGRGNVRRYDPYQPNRKAQWQWSVQSGADVLHVLGMLWPYLGERRREQATFVMERAAKIGEGAGFCKRGHDLSDPVHLYLHERTGKRHCRTCRRAYMRRRWRLRLGD